MRQLGLFEQPSLNVIFELKKAMNDAVVMSGMSREQVVDRMNEVAMKYGICLMSGNAKKLNLATFEKWLNPADHARCPSIKALPVFCAAVKNMAPLQVLAQPLGGRLIDSDEIKLLEWAKAYHEAKKARKRMRQLEAEI